MAPHVEIFVCWRSRSPTREKQRIGARQIEGEHDISESDVRGVDRIFLHRGPEVRTARDLEQMFHAHN